MTTSVRFCSSYGLKNGILSPSKSKLVQCENTVLTRTLSMTLRIRTKVLLHVWSYDFYDTTLSTEKQRRHMKSLFIGRRCNSSTVLRRQDHQRTIFLNFRPKKELAIILFILEVTNIYHKASLNIFL